MRSRGALPHVWTLTAFALGMLWSCTPGSDSGKIVFVSGESLRRLSVFEMELDGSNRRPIPEMPSPVGDFSISRDGKVYAYAAPNPEKTQSAIWVGVRGGPPPTQMQVPKDAIMPEVSPDGGQLAFITVWSESMDVMVCPTNGGKPQPVTATPKNREAFPSFSFDGKQLSFVRLGDARGPEVQCDIWLLDLRTGKETLILRDTHYVASPPRFSPDGKSIVYSANKPLPQFDLFLISIADKKIRRLTSDGHSFNPRFIDNDTVLFESNLTGRNQLAILDLKTGKQRVLASDSNDYAGHYVEGSRD